MFTQRLSMDCTKEQYEKYLKDELLKMGYKEDLLLCWNNQFIKVDGESVGTVHKHNIREDRTYLGSFNAPLFLALAAMTDSPFGCYGEYYTDGKNWLKVPIKASNTGFLCKATKEEIMAKFGEKNNEKQMVGAIINDTINNCNKIHEIALAWDDFVESLEGCFIDKLKSRGYKILKPTTGEEV